MSNVHVDMANCNGFLALPFLSFAVALASLSNIFSSMLSLTIATICIHCTGREDRSTYYTLG